MNILGMASLVTLRMAGYDLVEDFVVVDFLGSDEFILGRSFIRAYGVLIDLNEKVLTVRNPERIVPTREDSIQDVNKRVPVYVDETLKVKNKEMYVKRGSEIQLENRQVHLESDVNAKGNVYLGRALTRIKNGKS